MSFSIDDGWDNCGPVARAGNAAFGVYCRCGAWVARNISSGSITEPVVPTEVAVAYGSPELARKLVDVGLWEAVDGGWLLVDYLARNQSAAQVQARRKADADRKANWRAKEQARADKAKDSKGSHAVTPRGLRSSFTDPKGSGARPTPCALHAGQSADNCGPCRAEALGAA